MTSSPETWRHFLAHLELGIPLSLAGHGIALIPLIDLAPRQLDVDALRWGIEYGRTRVTEIGEGRVDRVRVEHSGLQPLLILDGEEVVGAKQNRVFNASFLVSPDMPADLPVSCVEQHRWRPTSEAFASSGRTVVTSVRATKLERVATSVITTREYDSRQREVWTGVTQYLGRTGVRSHTDSHAEGADRRQAGIDAVIATIPLQPGQVGVAAITGTRVVLDVFGSPELFGQARSVVLRGLLGDPSRQDIPADASDAVRRCIADLMRVTPHCMPAPGMGESFHAISEEHVGGAVAHDDRIYHLLAASRER